MSTHEMLEKGAELRELWTVLMPELVPPSPSQFLRWLSGFGEDIVAFSVNAAAHKYFERNGQMSQEEASKYVTGTCVHERDRDARASRTRRATEAKILRKQAKHKDKF